ncbi:MAG: 30S ribosomal protein S11 [Endomicrobium sp.]|jgi:small subunit ribosomal protein S11|nr:30S ribosomal protein S11 [Endomicrobium sp.]
MSDVKAKNLTHKKKYIGGIAKAYILSSFNNTIISITDNNGNVLVWSSGGQGFKGSKKSTSFSAQMTALSVGKKAIDIGVKQISVFVNGPGPGRETAIRGLQSSGLNIKTIKDVTPIPHNGCRSPKLRRV